MYSRVATYKAYLLRQPAVCYKKHITYCFANCNIVSCYRKPQSIYVVATNVVDRLRRRSSTSLTITAQRHLVCLCAIIQACHNYPKSTLNPMPLCRKQCLQQCRLKDCPRRYRYPRGRISQTKAKTNMWSGREQFQSTIDHITLSSDWIPIRYCSDCCVYCSMQNKGIDQLGKKEIN